MPDAPTTVRAFHNDPAVQAMAMARVRAHEAADEIVQGVYWQHGKGCAVGCLTHDAKTPHSTMERLYGVPKWLALLLDRVFESLPNAEAKTFPRRFIEAVPLGAALDAVRLPFLSSLMLDPTYGISASTSDATVRALAQEVGERLREGRDLSGPAADALTTRLRAAWDARAAWATELLRLVALAPVEVSNG